MSPRPDASAQRMATDATVIERLRFAPISYVLSHTSEELADQAQLIDPLPREFDAMHNGITWQIRRLDGLRVEGYWVAAVTVAGSALPAVLFAAFSVNCLRHSFASAPGGAAGMESPAGAGPP